MSVVNVYTLPETFAILYIQILTIQWRDDVWNVNKSINGLRPQTGVARAVYRTLGVQSGNISFSEC